MYNIFDMATL